ncbi:MAG: YbgC/FadM family acyl-CoA thioesterase, partial [Betaproteobacteria bacterium]
RGDPAERRAVPSSPAPSGGGSRSEHRGDVFSFPVRVYYEDTDAAGVVYYANYLKFMERARTEWLDHHAMPLPELERAHGVVFVVTRAEVDFRGAARLGDRLEAIVAVASGGRARLDAHQSVRRDGEVLVDARFRLACLARDGWKPARIPSPLARLLEHER